MGLVLDEIGGDMQPGAGGDDGGHNQQLAVAPHERSIAVRVQDRRRRQHVIHPPQAERESGSRDADQRGIQRPTLLLDHRRQRGDRAHDSLAQRNDGEQAVALGNVMRMPGGAAVHALSQDGRRELNRARA